MANTPVPMPQPTIPPLSLSSYKIISFDVYGTLIQYKQHILHSFNPLISRLPESSNYRNTTPLSTHIPDSATTGDIEFLKVFQTQEDSIKLELASKPLRFDEVLREIYRRIAAQLDLSVDESEVDAFGSESNIRSWPCFPGTVDALRRIQSANDKYQLVALSNVDKYATDISFASTGLDGVRWAKVFTAEEFGMSAEDLKLADQRKLEALQRYAEEKGVKKEEVLHVAQSLGHDHAPCKKMGISSVFLTGDGPIWGKESESRMAVEKGLVGYAWRCENLTEFASVVEKDVGKV